MKAEVEQQAQNEVKNLLHEYVVAPLRGEILPALEQMKTSIEVMDNSTQGKIEETAKGTKRAINYLKEGLDNSFHFEDEEDLFEDVKHSVSTDKKELVKKIDDAVNQMKGSIDELKSDVAALREESSLKQEQVKASILEEESKNSDKIIEHIGDLETESEKKYTAISTVLGTLERSLDSGLKETDAAMKTAHKELKRLVNENESSLEEALQEQEKKLIRKLDALQESLDEVRQSVSDGFEGSGQKAESLRNEIVETIRESEAEMKTAYEKQYKTLLYVCLSFGIIDFIGIAAVIALYFIR